MPRKKKVDQIKEPYVYPHNDDLPGFLIQEGVIKTVAGVQALHFHLCMKVNGSRDFNSFMKLTPGDHIEIDLPVDLAGGDFTKKKYEVTYGK